MLEAKFSLDLHINAKPAQKARCWLWFAVFYAACEAKLCGLGGAKCSESNPPVITVICGLCRQQIRLRGCMICSWKSTPRKSKSILSEKPLKDKVLCFIENVVLVFVCVCMFIGDYLVCYSVKYCSILFCFVWRKIRILNANFELQTLTVLVWICSWAWSVL